MFKDPSTRYRNITLLLGSMLPPMGGLVIAPSIAGMGRHFSDVPDIEFLASLAVTLPSLVVAIISFSMGAMVDRYGRRPILLSSALICGLIGSAGFFLDSLMLILATRLLLGFGIAGLMTSITTIAGDVFIGEERRQFLGLQSMSMNVGGIIFLGIGGALADISWRLPFTLYCLPLILLVAFFIFIPETRQRNTSDKINQKNNSIDDEVIANPIPPLVALFFAFSLGSSFFYISPVLMAHVFESINLNATKVGVALALLSLSSALIGTQFHRISTKLGTPSTLIWIFTCLTLGYFIVGSSNTFASMSAGLIVTGLGLGVYIPLTFSCGMSAVHGKYMGVAIGTITSAMFFGQFLAPIVGKLLQSMAVQDAFINVAKISFAFLIFLVIFKSYKVYNTYKT